MDRAILGRPAALISEGAYRCFSTGTGLGRTAPARVMMSIGGRERSDGRDEARQPVRR